MAVADPRAAARALADVVARARQQV